MKIDYQDFEIKINMKTIMLFEQMADKSFYEMNDEDLILLIYCSLVINNNQKITLSRFEMILKNEKIAKTLMRKCQEELDFITQMTNMENENKQEKKKNDNKVDRISSIINLLILYYNLDINYVMYDMRLWELSPLVKSMEEKTKADIIEKRFWAYINICPHIDSKKVKSPEDLIPFPWEKEEKKKKQNQDLENNRFAIQNMIGKNIFGEPIKKQETNG